MSLPTSYLAIQLIISSRLSIVTARTDQQSKPYQIIVQAMQMMR